MKPAAFSFHLNSFLARLLFMVSCSFASYPYNNGATITWTIGQSMTFYTTFPGSLYTNQTSFAGSLPSGINLNYSTGTISGAPTSGNGGSVTYNIQVSGLSNGAGGYTSDVCPIKIFIPKPGQPNTLTYPSHGSYIAGVAMAPLTPSLTTYSGTATSPKYSITPALPPDILMDSITGVISGTPAGPSNVNYTVTFTNSGGSATTTVNITVAVTAPSGLSYSENTATYVLGNTITSNTPTVTGLVASYSISPALPTGLTINTTTGVISGTPTVSKTAISYTVTATNAAGSTTKVISISVLGITYASTPATYTRNVPITNNSPTITGTVTGFSISPSLPTGLSLNTTTGIISGTPSANASATDYTITATNSSGSTTATVNVTVIDPPSSLIYSPNPAIYAVGTAISPNIPTVSGPVVSYSVTPTLPQGLSLNSATGYITGTPTTATAATNYTVTASNGAGGTTTVSLNITVLTPPSNLFYSKNPATYTINVAAANNTPTVTGTATSYSVSPALPAGLSLNTSTGVISGTPTAVTTAIDYTITAGNSAGSSTTATVNITVVAPPSGLAYSTNPAVYPLGSAINANTPTVNGLVTGYSASPSLPAGLSLNATTGVITGAPTTAQAAANYTITASNGAGGTTTVVLSIAVQASPSGLYYASNPAKYTVGVAANNVPTFTGTSPTFSISPSLPSGLSLNVSTGVISGIPTTTSPAANYAVTLTNSVGITNTTLNITILSLPSGLFYSVNPVTFRVGTPITPDTPTVTGPVASYSITPSLPTGISLNTTTGIISGTPSAVATAATYVITANNGGGGTTTTALNITVNPVGIAARWSSNGLTFRIGNSSSATLELPGETTRIAILNLWGKTVWSADISENSTRDLTWNGRTLDNRTAPSGMYIVRTISTDSKQKSTRIGTKVILYTP